MVTKRIAGALIVLVALVGCSASQPSPPPAGATGAWVKLPKGPLDARRSAHVVRSGQRVLVFGGTAARACPPNADCVAPFEAPFRDGAAYDPSSQTWAPIAEAPIPVGFGSVAATRDRVYVLINEFGSSHRDVRAGFLVYNATKDAWTELRTPPAADRLRLASVGDTVAAYHTSQENGIEDDLLYDAESNAWRALPVDPLAPSFDRTMVGAPDGIVLTGIRVVADPGGGRFPSVYRAALLRKGKWRRLPDSEVVGSNPSWALVGDRLINPTIDRIDGGETNRLPRPFPAGGILDLAQNRWRPLSDAPAAPGEFTGVHAWGSRYVVAGQGWVFDAETDRWLRLGRPPDGPDDEVGAAWAQDRLMVWGGVDWRGNEGVLLADGWMWTPPDA